MVEANGIKLADELRAITGPAFDIKAILQGIHALLEDHGSDDMNGNVWAARQLAEQALALPDNIYGDRAYKLIKRLEEIDAMEVHLG